jgi:hypothetical protein
MTPLDDMSLTNCVNKITYCSDAVGGKVYNNACVEIIVHNVEVDDD